MKIRRYLKRAAQTTLFLIPFVLGIIGFADLYEDLFSRIFHTMAMFALNFDADEAYLQAHRYLQVARICAGAATFSVVIVILNDFWASFSAFVRIRLFRAVVVHGGGERADRVLRGIRESGRNAVPYSCRMCFRAKDQVLAFDTDAGSLRYMEAHRQELFPEGKTGRRKIVLCSDTCSGNEGTREEFTVYNPAEVCARLYWREHWLDRGRTDGEPGLPPVRNVAILGFGRFGEQLLDEALVLNVTDRQLEVTEADRPILGKHFGAVQAEPGVAYHVVGSDGAEYRAMHPMLSAFLNSGGADGGHKDSLIFYPSLADMGFRKLNSMDRIIIALDDPEECLELLSRIVSAGRTDGIHIHCADEKLLYALYQAEKERLTIIPFGMNRVLYDYENLFRERMEQSAMDLNFSYARAATDGAADRAREESWRRLTWFKKQSNFANCDHQVIKEGLLKRYPYQEDPDTDTANLLMEIEHTRWERFYWLNNWEYGPERDDPGRRHPDLVPFTALSREEQLKDYRMYR